MFFFMPHTESREKIINEFAERLTYQHSKTYETTPVCNPREIINIKPASEMRIAMKSTGNAKAIKSSSQISGANSHQEVECPKCRWKLPKEFQTEYQSIHFKRCSYDSESSGIDKKFWEGCNQDLYKYKFTYEEHLEKIREKMMQNSLDYEECSVLEKKMKKDKESNQKSAKTTSNSSANSKKMNLQELEPKVEKKMSLNANSNLEKKKKTIGLPLVNSLEFNPTEYFEKLEKSKSSK